MLSGAFGFDPLITIGGGLTGVFIEVGVLFEPFEEGFGSSYY